MSMVLQTRYGILVKQIGILSVEASAISGHKISPPPQLCLLNCANSDPNNQRT
jgi:hypothetical protein